MKTTCLRFVLMGLLTCLFSTTVFGQSFAHIENEDPAGGTNDTIGISCSYVAWLSVIVANLELYGSPNSQGHYHLPSNCPDIYVSYNFGGYFSGVKEIVSFKFDKDLTDDINNGIKYYKRRVHLGFMSFRELCDTADQNSNIYIPYTLELQTESGNPYPICLYTYHDDIFACNAFDGTAAYCEDQSSLPGSPTCNSAELAYITGSAETKCSACDPEREGFRNARLNKEEGFQNVAITPNPFKSGIEITWSSGEPVEVIHLFDVNGRQLEYRKVSKQSENKNLYLETESLMPGLYFLQLRNAENSKVFKLIKK